MGQSVGRDDPTRFLRAWGFDLGRYLVTIRAEVTFFVQFQCFFQFEEIATSSLFKQIRDFVGKRAAEVDARDWWPSQDSAGPTQWESGAQFAVPGLSDCAPVVCDDSTI